MARITRFAINGIRSSLCLVGGFEVLSWVFRPR